MHASEPNAAGHVGPVTQLRLAPQLGGLGVVVRERLAGKGSILLL